jgi:hypothetical protein
MFLRIVKPIRAALSSSTGAPVAMTAISLLALELFRLCWPGEFYAVSPRNWGILWMIYTT